MRKRYEVPKICGPFGLATASEAVVAVAAVLFMAWMLYVWFSR